MAAQIIAENLSKHYIRHESSSSRFRKRRVRVDALSGVSFVVEEGELLAYIGPNGAGKSTTVKLMSGILAPDGGEITVMGRVPWKQRTAHVREIGVVFGQRTQLWWDLPVKDSFELLRDIYRVPEREYRRVLGELSDRLKLGELMGAQVRQLSLGQRMRCELSASLLHSPRLLMLDEPTIGLDAVSKLAVRDFILEMNRTRGVTVILTTHDMDDVESLCNRVLMIAGGRILMDGGMAALREGASARVLTAELGPGAQVGALPFEVGEVRCEGGHMTVQYDAALVDTARLIAYLAAQYALRDVTVEHPPIERIIANLYGRMEGGA